MGISCEDKQEEGWGPSGSQTASLPPPLLLIEDCRCYLFEICLYSGVNLFEAIEAMGTGGKISANW